MSRRYHEPIHMIAERPGDPIAEPGEPATPRMFVWRRRRYRILTVLARWIEAEPWWRRSGFSPGGAAADSLVWRVEAVERGCSPGVFDVVQRTGAQPGWYLVRRFD